MVLPLRTVQRKKNGPCFMNKINTHTMATACEEPMGANRGFAHHHEDDHKGWQERDTLTIWQTLNKRGLALMGILPHQPRRQWGGAKANGDIVIFRLGTALYGLPAHLVYNSRPLGLYEPLPFTPPCIVGITTFENREMVVIDIRPLVSGKHLPPRTDELMLIVRLKSKETGILTDGIVSYPR